jgi:hypothetical protein
MINTFPISYWGSIAYLSDLVKEETVVLECFEHFPKQTHRNRFQIVYPQGLLSLTVPVIKYNGSKTHTKDVLISNDKVALKKNWKAVVSAYASSPYFDHYERELEMLFLKPNENLVFHCKDILSFLFTCWDFDTKLEFSKTFDWKEQSNELSKDYLSKSVLMSYTEYDQVLFNSGQQFIPNVSSMDLLSNLGPMGRNLITRQL